MPIIPACCDFVTIVTGLPIFWVSSLKRFIVSKRTRIRIYREKASLLSLGVLFFFRQAVVHGIGFSLAICDEISRNYIQLFRNIRAFRLSFLFQQINHTIISVLSDK